MPPSRSASPSVRGRGGAARGKRGVKTPAFTGRRSKEERDAIAKEQAARDRERTKEQVAADKRREADAQRQARREANKQKNARGGFSGVASGPFSLGSSKEGRSTCRNLAIDTNYCYRQEEQPEPRILGLWCRIRLSSRARQDRRWWLRKLRSVGRWRWRKRGRGWLVDQERRRRS